MALTEFPLVRFSRTENECVGNITAMITRGHKNIQKSLVRGVAALCLEYESPSNGKVNYVTFELGETPI